MNELLLWASAIGSGTSASLKRKATELLPARGGGPSSFRRAVWSLGSLAHCEFGTSADGGWRVAPPVLAAGDRAGAVSAILCGARSAQLLARLAEAPGVVMSVAGQRDGPDVVEVSTSTAADLIRVARQSGIPIQWNAPLAILSAFDPPTLMNCREIPLPTGGWVVERFSRSQVRWIESNVADARTKHRGLFRFKSDYETIHAYRDGSITREVPPGIAKYWVLGRRQRAMKLDLARGFISFPPAAKPPGLVDRALVVTSGRLPVLSDGRIVYSDVTAPVAAAVSATLRALALGAEK